MTSSSSATPRMLTGVPGLDLVLDGGLPRNRLYLVQGDPGAGKTTLALQFLLTGAKAGERVLYVTLSETRAEIAAVAVSHDWDLTGVEVFEMGMASGADATDEDNTLYVTADVELGERMNALLALVDQLRPSRIVLDSCTELRLLAQSALRFRRQVLALKEGLIQRDCTVVLIENPLVGSGDPLLQSLVHGVILMEQLTHVYGAERRRLRVAKLREVRFRGGFHDITIEHRGVVVHPRMVANEHQHDFLREQISSGIAEIDSLTGGGLDRGTSTLMLGPAGSGKSALSTQFAIAAAERGDRTAMFAFDEGVGTLFQRAESLGMPLTRYVDSGHILVQQVDPAEMSPGEFVGILRQTVEAADARVVIIDSLNGYLQSMPEEQFLTTQLHELLSYMRQRGVVVIMVVAQHGFIGGAIESPVDISYLADNVIVFRYFEAAGRVRKAISMVKRRAGMHEDAIREFTLSKAGFKVSAPLTSFRGVLTGTPTYEGGSQELLGKDNG